MEESRHRVCVIGGAGYVGSSLVKKLVDEGYTVHATLRSLSEESKVGLLKSFAGADERLKLFEADLFNKSEQIEQAIHGCEFVFLVATPTPQAGRLNVDEIVEGVKNVAYACSRCGSVRRLIYTASTGAASPLKEDGSGFKGVMDETCWTPFPLPFHHSNDSLRDYMESKTLAEKEILKIGNDEEGLEVVSLALGAVGGDTCLWYCPFSVSALFSHLIDDENGHKSLKFVEDLLGKIPIVHIEDVCDAHILAMKAPNGSMSGRFLCANSFVSAAEMANYLRHNYPQFHLNLQDQDCSCMTNGPERQVVLNYEKLLHKGFTYKKSLKDVVDDSISCGRRFGHL